MKKILFALIAASALLTAFGANAQEAAIRKNLADRLPQLPKIDEIRKSEMPGVWEIRVNGNDILYTDEQGNYLIQGTMMDTKGGRNLTDERIDQLTAVDFNSLPLADAFKIVRGDGKRKIAIFEDPNCGYCKRFEADLQNVNNVTIHVFLYPILGPDSIEKSRAIWCARDKGKTWTDWMVSSKSLPTSVDCDASALVRNVELGRKHKITGTPTMLFADNSRVPGAISSQQVEKFLSTIK